ncbi:ABC transporter permease [Microbulbifer yueqingensis]|uniref:Nitrate/nitrite transport system permease protein n=1 Tax=Microbulbifer yueqingensis TaxID=658219 RepID=A0A1G9E0F1_9GAMM|nr:ABC transporter permease [Microbulbifer yueqingensis]SDK69583.1 nitrate/nitrite transport system permease protein [Microbulbifer yueqingensis]
MSTITMTPGRLLRWKPQVDGRGLLTTTVKLVALPAAGILVFLLLWSAGARNIDTSLGQFPGPLAVGEQFGALYTEHQRSREKEVAFYERQRERNARRVAEDPGYEPKIRDYTGKETFIDQIGTSLVTVMSGFLLAAMIAIPLGIAIGLSPGLNAACNPIIQVFKPVSPLAWLPLVTMVVSALYATPDPVIAKSFINSMITVTLCCLWPMVINTAVGVASIDRDLVNVSRVLRLPPLQHVRRIVLPASVPMIFTGMRLSLGVAWMVLIAAEMLAQNPGLGKFVWDEFQNGSSDSLARIMAAVIVIGFIGFLLDRSMLQLQRFFSWDKGTATH